MHQVETQTQLFLQAGRFFFCSSTAEHRGIVSEFVPSSDRAQIKIKFTTEGSQFVRQSFLTPLVSPNQCKYHAQRKFIASRTDVVQMLINKIWFADILTDMLSSDQVDDANEKVSSRDGIGLNYGFWCYRQD